MNELFVSIKVDREERPDVDALYMDAVVSLTGQGGWPMTVFLTPDGEPFYGGTYYPPVPRPGMPVLPRRCSRRSRRRGASAAVEVGEMAARLDRRRCGESAQRARAPRRRVTDAITDRAVEHLSQIHDPNWGGFGAGAEVPARAAPSVPAARPCPHR